MRTKIFILGLLAPLLSFGQEAGNPGWNNTFRPDPNSVTELKKIQSSRSGTPPAPRLGSSSLSDPEAAGSLAQAVPPAGGGMPLGPMLPAGNIADEITPEIASLATALRNDPVKIFEYVYNNIDYECYYGSKKGAHLTLLEGSGNDCDQASLLISLLRSAGHTASYEFGPCSFSYEDLRAWWGLVEIPYSYMSNSQFEDEFDIPDGSYADTIRWRKWLAAYEFAKAGGYFYVEPYLLGDDPYVSIPFVWVKVTLNGNIYEVSPAFKGYSATTPLDIATASGYDLATLFDAAGGTTGSAQLGSSGSVGWVTDLSETAIDGYLTARTASLLNTLKTDHHAKSVDELVGTRRILRDSFTSLAEAPLIFPDIFAATWCPMESWTAVPESKMSKVTLRAGTYDYALGTFSTPLAYEQTIPMPSLKGRKLSLSFSGDNARIHLDEELVGAAFPCPGTLIDFQFEVSHDHYFLTRNQDETYTPTDALWSKEKGTSKYYKHDANAYTFAYSFANPSRQLRARQDQLDRYTRAGLPATDWRMVSEGLNVMGLSFYQQVWDLRRTASSIRNMRPMSHHTFGRASQEGTFYIDVFLNTASLASPDIDFDDATDYHKLETLFASAMEHGVIEQTQRGTVAVSTVRMLQQANQRHEKIYALSAYEAGIQTYWDSFAALLNNYDPAFLTSIRAQMEPGNYLLIPENGSIPVGDWSGLGYSLTGDGRALMIISGGLNGGYSTQDSLYLAAAAFSYGNQSIPGYEITGSSIFDSSHTPLTTDPWFSWDPIEMASGAYYLDRTDLTLGSEAPYGLASARQYHSNRRYSDEGGIGFGWTHSNHVTLAERSAPDASLGRVNGYQMAPLLVAFIAADSMLDTSASPKNRVLQALIVHWGLEQMKYKAVSVTMGSRSIQFIRMPDGTHVPPPGMNLTLTKNTAGNYELAERHGNTMVFDSEFRLDTITSPNGVATDYNYDGTTGKLASITDGYGRTFTYTWSGGHITAITDSTGRTVSYGYDTAGDLTSITDPEGKVWTYAYDSEHRMTSLKDPENRTIAENDYDVQSRVTRQRSMGDTQREWSYLYSGFVNTEIDPLGGERVYFHDERGRNIGGQDALGNKTSIEYDGQDRKLRETTAEGNLSQWTYDGDNNPTTFTDPLGKITQNVYDPQTLLLQRVRDPRGKDTTFTYTAQHQVETVTDPLLHVVKTTYNTDGTIDTVRDAEGKLTNHDYDAYGQVNKTTYHDASFKTFTSNARGDVLTSTDEEGRTTTTTWNARRQLLTSTLPAIPSEAPAGTTNTYDDSGNLQTATDANGNVTNSTWTALGKIASVTLPSLPAGNNVVTTTYDLCDRPVNVTNSVGQTVTTEYDAAGRAIAVTDALSRRTETIYDGDGRVTETKDPLNRITKQGWNERGERTGSTDAMNKQSGYGYDDNGNATSVVNRRGKTHTSTYDDANRPSTSTTPSGKTSAMTYFRNDLVKTILEPSSQNTTFGYNGRNQLQVKADASGFINYVYDDSGRVLTTTQGTDVITRTYDERGLLKNFTNADGDMLQYKYDANENLTLLTYPDGKQVHYTYNSRNLMSTVTDWQGGVTTYDYDRLGQLRKVLNANGTLTIIKRDAANQIESIAETRSNTAFSLLKFRLDAGGQIERRLRAPLISATLAQPSFTSTYDDDNRLATINGQSITHDADGNMTNGPISPASGNVPLTYNSRNQLLTAGGVTYTYDAEGRRRTLMDGTGTTRDVIDPNSKLDRLLVRHHPGGSKTFYVHGVGLLYEVGQTGNTKTYHFDQVGNTIARTDGSGDVIGRAEYSPYGLNIVKLGDMGNPFLGNGQWGVTTETNGLLHMRARYYSPYLMRFLNPDPIGFGGGSNWFAFAEGNPISNADPTGLVAFAFPSELNRDPEFTRGYWLGAGAAVPAGLGMTAAVFTGPVVGGGLMSAGINMTEQMAEEVAFPESSSFSGTSLAVDTGIGAAVPYGLSKGVPFVAKMLPTSTKGAIGEAFSYINGVFQGRGFSPLAQEAMPLQGLPSKNWPIPDYTYPGQGVAGGPLYVEAKFGTASLSGAQRAGARQAGVDWITEKWTYPWLGNSSGQIGKILSGGFTGIK